MAEQLLTPGLTRAVLAEGTSNELDLSPWLIQANAQRSALQEQSGLILTTGQLQLAWYADSAGLLPQLDDRASSIWRKGRLVSCYCGSQLAPVLGKLYIDTCESDEESQTFTIQLACILSLKQNAGQSTVVNCINFADGTGLGSVASSLAELIAPSQVAEVPELGGKLFEPLFLSASTSPSSQLGTILADQGYFCYQDEAGLLQFRSWLQPIAPADGITLNRRNCYTYARASSQELPADVLIGTGSFKSAKVLPIVKTHAEQYADERKIVTDTLTNSNERIAKKWTQSIVSANQAAPAIANGQAFLVQEERSEETARYETDKHPLSAIACSPETDEGRLKSRLINTYRAQAKALEAYWSARAEYEGEAPYKLPGATNWSSVLAETEYFSVQYVLPEPKQILILAQLDSPGTGFSGSSSSADRPFVEYIRIKKELAGAIFPLIGKPDLGRGDGLATFRDPYELIVTEYEIKRYELQEDERTWAYTRKLYVNTYRLKSEAINSMVTQTDDATGLYIFQPGEVIDAALQWQLAEWETNNSAGLEEPERIAVQIVQTETPAKIVLYMHEPPDNGLVKTGDYSIGEYCPTVSTAYSNMASILVRQWARYKGQLVSFDAQLANFKPEPLAPLTITDPIAGKVLTFAMDSQSASYDKMSGLFACQGLLAYSTKYAEPGFENTDEPIEPSKQPKPNGKPPDDATLAYFTELAIDEAFSLFSQADVQFASQLGYVLSEPMASQQVWPALLPIVIEFSFAVAPIISNSAGNKLFANASVDIAETMGWFGYLSSDGTDSYWLYEA